VKVEVNELYFAMDSTEGDYEVESRLTPIPKSSLTFTLEKAAFVLISCKITVQGDIEVWLFLDGQRVLCWNPNQYFSDPFDINLVMTAVVAAGVHQVSVSAFCQNAVGPRDWSPRWEREGKPCAKVLRSDVHPLSIQVMAK